MPTKPITPAEAIALNALDESQVESAVVAVNAFLRAYDGTRKIMVDADKLGPTTKVRAAVEASFRLAGWQVVYHSCQRDGDWYEFGK